MSSEVTIRTYIAGFILSIILTLTAFKIVDNGRLQDMGLIVILLGFAIIQLFVQLLFFLHLDSEKRPRWNLTAFAFMAVVLVILVAGSLWIMYSLDYHMGEGIEYEENILEEEGINL